MRSIFESQTAVSANLSSHKGTFREDKRTLKGSYLKLCVDTCVSRTSVSVETSRFISGVTSSSLGVAVFLDLKSQRFMEERGRDRIVEVLLPLLPFQEVHLCSGGGIQLVTRGGWVC